MGRWAVDDAGAVPRSLVVSRPASGVGRRRGFRGLGVRSGTNRLERRLSVRLGQSRESRARGLWARSTASGRRAEGRASLRLAGCACEGCASSPPAVTEVVSPRLAGCG
jgi:hypothetical protein